MSRFALRATLAALAFASVAASTTACGLVLGIGDHELYPPEAGTPLFDEEFDAAALDPNKWIIAGDGVWSIEGGTGIQSNPTTQFSTIYAKDFAQATDYHLVARMRSTGLFGQGYALAPEVAFRVDPTVDAGGIPDSYHCDFNLSMAQLIVDQTTPNNAPGFSSVDAGIPANFDEGTPFVLDAVVSGSNVTCTLTVDGLGVVATTSTDQLARRAGSFGLKTFESSAQFFYFRVYAAK